MFIVHSVKPKHLPSFLLNAGLRPSPKLFIEGLNPALSFTRLIVFYLLIFSSYEVNLALKILLIICTLTHDMVQATIITSYCLQAQLLQAHLMFLKERLLNRTITPLNWMRVRYC